MKMDKVLPVDDHIKILMNGEAQKESCESYSPDDFSVPEWFDEDKFKRGQKYIQYNIFSQFTNTLSGLICVLSIPTILEVLINTQRSSTTLSAYRRYVSTIFHAFSWYTDDFKPGSDLWKSLITVRSRHFRSSTVLKAKSQGFISQRDLAYTQFGFFGIGLLFPEKIGMRAADPEDIEGYVHFWRTIGFMIGIQDRYNLCRPSVEETKEVCKHLQKEVYCKTLSHPPEYFHFMLKALLDGVWFYSPMLSEGSFFYFTLWLVGLEDYPFDFNMENFRIKYFDESNGNVTNNNRVEKETVNGLEMSKELGWLNKMKLKMLMGLHKNLLVTNLGRLYFNGQTYLSVFLLKTFPFLSFMYFGIKDSWVNMFKEDIKISTKPIPNKTMFMIKQY